jgi:hypothetical protein
LQYLAQAAVHLSAPWSLAWAILALVVYGQDTESLERRPASMPDLLTIEDTGTLALVLLALDHERALSDLGVSS